MAHRCAVVVDRDPAVLALLAADLGRSGYLVESLTSTVGLTPDLLALARPTLVVVDAELPGLGRAALFVLLRSLKQRCSVRLVLTTDDPNGPSHSSLDVDLVVARSTLASQGGAALGVDQTKAIALDVRAIVDEVLGENPRVACEPVEVRIDLFSRSNFCSDLDRRLRGVFVAGATLYPVGQEVELHVDLLGRTRLTLAGAVAWQRSFSALGAKANPGVGVKLTAPSDADVAIVKRFFEHRAPLTWVE